MASLSKQFPAKTVIASESDPVATQKFKVVDASIEKISTDIVELQKSAIAKFHDARGAFIATSAITPTDPLLDPIRPSLSSLETELAGLDLTKSSTDSINGLTSAVKELNVNLKAIPTPVTQASIDVVAAQIAAVHTAISLTKTSLSDGENIKKLEASLATIDKDKASQADLDKINAALKTANDAIEALKNGGADLTAVNKAIADADTEIKALKTKQDATTESLVKTNQSVADLAILVAKGGTGTGTTSTDLKALQDKLTALDTAKAEKTALDGLDKSVRDLTTALASGATDAELAEAIKKVDAAIAVIESSLKPLIGRTVYTTATVLNAVIGDEIQLDGEGDIQLPAAPKDGAEVRIFDRLGKMKAGKNNVLLGAGDHWLIHDGSFAEGPMTFVDNQLQHGWMRLKYSSPTASWWPYIVYGVSTSTAKVKPEDTVGKIYISPGMDIQQSVKAAKPGDTIYLMGGTYRNADWDKPFAGRTKGSLALISLKGTEAAPITIRPHEDEKVTIESDVTAFALKDCEWLNIEGIEFKGRTDNIKYEDAIKLWWVTDSALLSQTGANGISINGCFHINIKDCVIHSWPGSGINENYSEYVFVEDCIIAANARWSVGGVHGFANSKPGTGRRENENDVKMIFTENLVIGSQQCIPSRVTSKGFAELVLDEGGGLHTQAQPSVTADGGVVFGKWEITSNLVMYCGKSGINQNGTGGLLIERNSCYQNVQNTSSADIHLSPPKDTDVTASMPGAIVRNNIIHSLDGKPSINRLGDPADKYNGVGANYVLAGNTANANYVANTQMTEVSAIFVDPSTNDFRKHPSIPADFGAPDAVVQALITKAQTYGIAIAPCPIKTDAAYLAKAKQQIIDDWPAPANIPAEFGPNFEIHDPVSGYHYTYATKAKYPNNPAI